tara:strand:- start:395 stop:1111 length:717 start_codon:yes stop_codon:yes gene_type:complete
MSFGGGSGGGGTQIVKQDPYDPAKPALNQIISEAGNLYNQGVQAAGYVAPSQQTTRGIATQELMADASAQQLGDTLSGKYLNPFLSPMLQDSANQIATAVNTEFSGAGRTPGSPMSQQQILSGITAEAVPYAFDQYERERQRQLGIASAAPTLTQVGSQLENIERQRNLAPFAALQQYGSIVNPIASGFPTQNSNTNVDPNRVTQGLGGAMIGNMMFPALAGATPYGAIAGAVLGGLL